MYYLELKQESAGIFRVTDKFTDDKPPTTGGRTFKQVDDETYRNFGIDDLYNSDIDRFEKVTPKRWAVITDSTVTNIVKAKWALSNSWVDITDNQTVKIGDTYDGVEFTSVVIEPPMVRVNIRQASLKLRMTTQERIAIRTASQTNPVVFDFFDLLNSEPKPNLAHPQVKAGFQYLESEGLIGAGRADEIINTPVSEEER